MRQVQENWDFLQVHVAALINGELPGLPPAMKSKRPIRGLAQRLKGKQGRFRTLSMLPECLELIAGKLPDWRSVHELPQ